MYNTFAYRRDEILVSCTPLVVADLTVTILDEEDRVSWVALRHVTHT